MEVYNKYAAQANTMKIEDITSRKRNQSILQRLKDNDASFDALIITTSRTNISRVVLLMIITIYLTAVKI